MRVLAALLCIVTHAWTVNANVEKTVFSAPAPATLAHVRPSVDDLRLHTLSPARTVLPALLPLRFPAADSPRGVESWYLLRGLRAGQRYEVRVCWPATQPTDFWLDAYPFAHVLDTPDLVASLAQYSEGLQDRDVQIEPYGPHESALFLRVQAAAAYYTTNRTLMEHPEPVHVDLILDPYLLNIFPKSLGPFAVYVTAVAIGAWFLSGYIYHWILSTVEPVNKPHAD